MSIGSLDARLAGLSLLHATVARLAGELGETPVQVATRPGQAWVGLTSHHAVHVAYDCASEARVHLEAERLLWAGRCGLPVPEVVLCGSSWLITTRAMHYEPLPGRLDVSAAVGAARIISAAVSPPPHVYRRHPAHGGSRWMRVLRVGRLLHSPVPQLEFKRLRRAFGGLRRDRLAHGNFRPRNILFDRARGMVTVVDWEFLTYQPAHYDLCFLWPRLTSPVDRDHVLEAAFADTSNRAALGVVHRWLAMRYLADLVTRAPRWRWDVDRIAEATQRVAEARANAASWGA